MSVLAVMTARNEAGYIERTLRSLIEEGLEVALIDNGSIDGTREIAERFLGAGLVRLIDLAWEGQHDLKRLLVAKEQVFSTSLHDWHVHVDADEWLRSTEDITLAEFLHRRVDGRFLVVDFDVFDFLPPPRVDMWQQDYRALSTQYYYFRPPQMRWWRAWRRGAAARLAEGAGHYLPSVEDRLVFPERQTLRHYVGLSWSHAIVKRANRAYPPEALQRGWHGNRLRMDNVGQFPDCELVRSASPWDTRQLDRSMASRYEFWESGFCEQLGGGTSSSQE